MSAVLSDCDTAEDIALWGRRKPQSLREFLVLKNGVPSEESFLRVLQALDPRQFEFAFRRWVAGVVGALRGGVAVDGKTVRGSGNGGETAIHMVSAFATELGIVLGPEKVAPYEAIDRHRQACKSHGRIVGQIGSVLPVQGIVDQADWPKCQTLVLVGSLRTVGDKEPGFERRYYISSRALTAEPLAAAVRGHGGVANRLHWVLDVSFGEDARTVRKDNAPQNMSPLKKIVLNLIRLDTTNQTKASLRLKRIVAAWDHHVRATILGPRRDDARGRKPCCAGGARVG